VITTVSLDGGQLALLIVQTNAFTPTERAVTPEVGSPGVVTFALPVSTVHTPVPTDAVLPAREVVVEQTVSSGPALAVVGAASRVMTTVSLDEGQLAFVIVQTNALAPTESPVTPEVGSPGVVTFALPVITVHTPVPTDAALPARVVVVEQTVSSGPAFALVGDASRVIVTLSLEAGQLALLIVQTKVFAPTERPVTPEVGSPGVVTFALPVITVHTPVPTDAALPASVVVVEQTVSSGPAFALVGASSRVITTVSLDEGQLALVIVQTNALAPTESPVTPEVGSPGVVTLALPVITVHTPVPTDAVLPARAVVVEQTVSSGPAFALVGDASRVITTVSVDEGQLALLIVQTNVFAPTERPVTAEVGLPGVVTLALPAITVHTPVPTVGALLARAAVVEQTVWSGPALAVVGAASRVMTTVSLDEGQLALLIVQTNALAPTESPVTPEVGSPGVVTFALPVITVHTPVPTNAVLPARAVVVEQTVSSGPAFALVGEASRVIITVSLDGVQLALLIVQTNVFAPTESPVTPEVGSPGVVTFALPAMTVHAPVPTVGVLPARVVVVEQTVPSGPAFAVVGDALLVTKTVSLDGGQLALLIVQTNVLTPTDSPVTAEVGLPGVVTLALPAITVHTPVPTVGALPARAAVVEQTVWSGPALAVVGEASRVIATVSVEDPHEPLLTVHLKRFGPTPRAVTVDVGLPGVVIVPEPLTRLQVPVPTEGVFPARVAVVEHTV
jgi:archaellin